MAVFRRLDAEKWRKWKFYPGAMFFLVPRLLILVILAIILLILLTIFLIGHDKTKPMSGCRRWIVRRIYIIWAHAFSLLAFWTCINYKFISEEDVNYYQEYLGTKEEQAAEQAKPESDGENG